MKKHVFALLFSVLFLLCSCGDSDKVEEDDQIKLGKTEYLLNYMDEKNIEATSIAEIRYTSENEYIATVSKSGKITGGKIGETKIVLENGYDTKKVNVNISPKYTLYPEPYEKIKFGASKENVKKTFGTPSYENTTGILYDAYHSFYTYIFLIDTNGNVTSMGIMCPTNKLGSLLDFLEERYTVIDVNEKQLTATFTNEKKDMGILFSLTDDMEDIMVIYVPATKTKSGEEENVKKEFNQIISLSKK